MNEKVKRPVGESENWWSQNWSINKLSSFLSPTLSHQMISLPQITPPSDELSMNFRPFKLFCFNFLSFPFPSFLINFFSLISNLCHKLYTLRYIDTQRGVRLEVVRVLSRAWVDTASIRYIHIRNFWSSCSCRRESKNVYKSRRDGYLWVVCRRKYTIFPFYFILGEWQHAYVHKYYRTENLCLCKNF